ncbi:MAG: hypothetical protein IPN46_11010 [Saprospiraceae bacterium]|nr:hypothetical protein [Saprospiraceae bacterium]
MAFSEFPFWHVPPKISYLKSTLILMLVHLSPGNIPKVLSAQFSWYKRSGQSLGSHMVMNLGLGNISNYNNLKAPINKLDGLNFWVADNMVQNFNKKLFHGIS